MASREQLQAWSITRRKLLVTALGIALGSGALDVVFGGKSTGTPSAVSTATPNQALLRDQELHATATAGSGQEVVGDALGQLPEAILANVRAATFVITARFGRPGLTGTAVAVELPGEPENGDIMLFTSAHSMTNFGTQPLTTVTGLELKRPHIDSGWTILTPRNGDAQLAVPGDYRQGVFSRDLCAIRIPSRIASRQLRGVQPLKVARTFPTIGEALVVGGFPQAMRGTDVNMDDTPLNISLAPVTARRTDNTYNVHCLEGAGASGAGLIDMTSGELMGLYTAAAENDRYQGLITPLVGLAEELSQQTRAQTGIMAYAVDLLYRHFLRVA